ncbi:fimbrial biogenesis chaperone [Erwinia aphidicola]|uniref:fimbrial biogenesis chaperone n=1 Tax=Erwinia aphidicola TaxID=68334 RepID=UPI003CECE3EA
MKALIFSFLFSLLTISLPSRSASSVLVWPIYQVIDADQNGSALWLENRGANRVSLQVRVLSWKQLKQTETYADQNIVVASPPFSTIEPGKRQLVRLIRTVPVPAGTESAFRIIIDEIPSDVPVSAENHSGLKLQMRYLLPLFLNGDGLWTRERKDIKLAASQISQPLLSWRTVNDRGKTFLLIRNQGSVHARLSNVFWGSSNNPDTAKMMFFRGFMGYVLPGESMKWPLPEGKSLPGGKMQLYAQLADNDPARPISHAE